jgi:hypothetical protein
MSKPKKQLLIFPTSVMARTTSSLFVRINPTMMLLKDIEMGRLIDRPVS